MPVSIGIGIVTAASAVYGAGKTAQNQKMKREFEAALANLNFEEKKRLDKELQEAKDLESKRKVIEETIAKTTETRIKAIEEKKLESQKSLNKLVTIAGIASVVLVVGLIIVYQKRKK